MRRALAIIAACFVGGAASGQSLMATGSLVRRSGAGAPPEPTHAWYVASDARGGSAVYHLPPRLGTSIPEGSIRFANQLHEPPAAVAARGETLYLLFEPAPVGPAFTSATPRPRQVLSMNAVETSPGRWATMPADRLEVCPPFPGGGELGGLTGSDVGVFGVTFVQGAATVYMLGEGEWTALPGTQPVPRAARLFGVPGGFGVLDADSGVARIGIAEFKGSERESREVHWTWTVLREEIGAAAARPGASILCCERTVVIGSPESDGSYGLYAAGFPLDPSSPWRELARLAGVPRDALFTTLDGDGRVAVLWLKPAVGTPGTMLIPQIRELSVATGRVLYEGEVRITSPISRADYLMLAISMTWVIGSIGIGVWNPRERAVVLPPDTGIAEAPRRGMAALIDLGIAMSIAAMARATPPSEALSVTWWLTPEGLIALMWALGGLAVGGTVMEAAAGKTIGKMLTGCRVVSVIPPNGSSSHRVGLGQAFIRNVIKWGLPPVGMMALFDPSGRPRADQIARTAVVTGLVPEEADDEE